MRSVVHKMATGEAVAEDFLVAASSLTRRSTCGLAWASRRELLEKHGLYDACILGSGGRAILNAALGRFDRGAQAANMTARGIDHYLEWARPYFDSVRGRGRKYRGPAPPSLARRFRRPRSMANEARYSTNSTSIRSLTSQLMTTVVGGGAPTSGHFTSQYAVTSNYEEKMAMRESRDRRVLSVGRQSLGRWTSGAGRGARMALFPSRRPLSCDRLRTGTHEKCSPTSIQTR